MANDVPDFENTNDRAEHASHDKQARTREVSSIQFPYGDLEQAIEVARAIFEHAGMQCQSDQLAAYLDHQHNSGTYRQKVSTARMFGLIDYEREQISLTDLGSKIVDQKNEREAKADAFLNVPLYRKVYEDFKGKTLPPRPAPFERVIVNYGVSSKQKSKARRAFERSAQQAGFFEHGSDRLVKPATVSGTSESRQENKEDGSSTDKGDDALPAGGSGGGGRGPQGPFENLDPLIIGLLHRLPKPGQSWSAKERARWLRTLAMNLSFIYEDDGEGDVKVEYRENRSENTED